MAGPERAAARLPAVAVAVAVAVVMVTLLSAGPVWAGNGLVRTSPADGAVLATAPGEVVLTFSTTPDPDASHVVVRTGSGTAVATGPLRGNGDALRESASIAAAGNYTVVFHAVFTDGSDMVGEVSFSVGTGVAPPVPPAAVRSADEAAVLEHDHGVDPASALFLVVDVIVLLGAVVLLLRRDRRWSARAALDAVENPTDKDARPHE